MSELTVTVEDNVGLNEPVKFASPTITSLDDVGTPVVQLVELVQLVLVVPFHDVDCESREASIIKLSKNIFRQNRSKVIQAVFLCCH